MIRALPAQTQRSQHKSLLPFRERDPGRRHLVGNVECEGMNTLAANDGVVCGARHSLSFTGPYTATP